MYTFAYSHFYGRLMQKETIVETICRYFAKQESHLLLYCSEILFAALNLTPFFSLTIKREKIATTQTIIDHIFSKSRLSSQIVSIRRFSFFFLVFFTALLHCCEVQARFLGRKLIKKISASGRILPLIQRAIKNCLPSFRILKIAEAFVNKATFHDTLILR
jgi:hypothetical protein